MPRPPKYTDDELLDEIRRLASELNIAPPRKRDMNKHGKHGAKTYQDRWGSWSSAVEAAGFEPREKGQEYAERPDECPLCGNEEPGLDFHHWRYGDDEIGCYLCRECHDLIHEGDAQTDNPDWLVHCIDNLVRLHVSHHDETTVEDIRERYNLPDVGVLVESALNEYTA